MKYNKVTEFLFMSFISKSIKNKKKTTVWTFFWVFENVFLYIFTHQIGITLWPSAYLPTCVGPHFAGQTVHVLLMHGLL